MPAPSQQSEDPRLLRLHADDNVLVARSAIAPGAAVTIGNHVVTLTQGLPIGHKIASRAIAAGEKIRKHGAPIGTATSAIAPGERVHLHNLRSDYTPSVALSGATT